MSRWCIVRRICGRLHAFRSGFLDAGHNSTQLPPSVVTRLRKSGCVLLMAQNEYIHTSRGHLLQAIVSIYCCTLRYVFLFLTVAEIMLGLFANGSRSRVLVLPCANRFTDKVSKCAVLSRHGRSGGNEVTGLEPE